jgi:hypothetical protein
MKVLSGEDCFDTWSRVINTMIKLEGLSPNWRALTYEETLAMSKAAIEKAQADDEAYHRRRQLRQSLDQGQEL